MGKEVEWTGIMNKPGVVELSAVNGQAVKIPLTMLTQIQLNHGKLDNYRMEL